MKTSCSAHFVVGAVMALLFLHKGGAAETERFVHEASFHAPPAQKVGANMTFAPDGTMLFTGGTILDLSNWQWLGPLYPSRNSPFQRIISVPGVTPSYLLEDSWLSLWEIKSQELRKLWWPPPIQWNERNPSHPFAKRFPLPDEVDGINNSSKNPRSPDLITRTPGSTFLSDWTKIVIFENHKNLVLRELKTGKALAKCEADLLDGKNRFIAYLGDKDRTVVCGSSLGLFTWDLKSPFLDPLPIKIEVGKPKPDFKWFALAPAKSILIAGGQNSGKNEFAIWDLTKNSMPTFLPYSPYNGNEKNTNETLCGAVTPDGKYCFVGHKKGVIRRLTLATGVVDQVVTPAENRFRDVEAITLSPDGKRLAWNSRSGGGYHVVYISALGGKRLPLDYESDYFPSGVGTTWVYRETPANGGQPIRRRETVLTHEIIGKQRCFLIHREQEEQEGRQTQWGSRGIVWYTVEKTGVYQITPGRYAGYKISEFDVNLKPTMIVPVRLEKSVSGSVTPEWFNMYGETIFWRDSPLKWSAEKSMSQEMVFGKARDVIIIERRDQNNKLTIERFAAGIGMFERRTSQSKLELVEYIPHKP